MKIATLGDINIDVVLAIDRLPILGEEVFSSSRVELLGGSAVNTGVVLARLGHDVTVLGAVGDDDPGRRAIAWLSSIGVSTAHTACDEVLPTAMNTILVTPDGERTMIGARGANVAYLNSDGWEDGLDWLHVSGYALMEGDQRKSALDAIETAQQLGIGSSLDVPAGVGAQIREALSHRLNTFSLVAGSQRSLAELTGAERPQDHLIDLGVQRIAVSSGPSPLVIVENSERIEVTPPRVEPLDATGAGDAMIAGLITATLAGWKLGPSAVLAAAAGAAATLVPGASETLSDLTTLATLLDPDLWVDTEEQSLITARLLIEALGITSNGGSSSSATAPAS